MSSLIEELKVTKSFETTTYVQHFPEVQHQVETQAVQLTRNWCRIVVKAKERNQLRIKIIGKVEQRPATARHRLAVIESH
jgi:hypothetical protein